MDNLTPEQIKQMITMLQSMLPSNIDAPEVTEEAKEAPAPQKYQNENMRTRESKRISGSFVNKFDKMMESALHKEDAIIDQKLAVHAPTPRIRRFDPIQVVCRVCGKTETVNPAILSESRDRYKCNSCARSPG